MGDGPGGIPGPAGARRAGDARRGAGVAGRPPGAAIGPQTDALDQLQQAEREFARQMQQRLGGAWGEPADRGDGTGQPRERGRARPARPADGQ